MDWTAHLKPGRFATNDGSIDAQNAHITGAGYGPNPMDPLQRDFDRILFSSAFRRLQGKAQVYLFPETDYVRTRLTHTLEVVSIGRLLSTLIIRQLARDNASFKDAMSRYQLNEIGLVDGISAACYAHDIGNAPFGHIGEYAIRAWFMDHLPESGGHLSLAEFKDVGRDFTEFDGNAQGFRMLTRLMGWGPTKGGLQLSYLTLSSFVKYPYGSSDDQNRDKKFGYMQSEASHFRQVADYLGLRGSKHLPYYRHPFSFIAESADDIAYLMSDIEDGVKMKLLDYSDIEDILIIIAKSQPGSLDEDRLRSIGSRTQNRLQFLRSAATNALIKWCAEAFTLLYGRHDSMLGHGIKHLLSSSAIVQDVRDARKHILAQCKSNIYYNSRKVRAEAGAYEVVRTLLDVFSEAIEDHIKSKGNIDNMNDRNVNVLRILNKGESDLDGSDPVALYRAIVDFVSGMTDQYATALAKSIRGINIAEF